MKEIEPKQKLLLKPEAILNYLMGEDKLHTLVTAKSSELTLLTTDQYLYESLGSVKERGEININLLVKLLEVTKILPHEDLLKEERKILTEERVEELRGMAK